jgi:hypothetical protein
MPWRRPGGMTDCGVIVFVWPWRHRDGRRGHAFAKLGGSWRCRHIIIRTVALQAVQTHSGGSHHGRPALWETRL